MMLEVMREEAVEALQRCTKEEAIRVLMGVAVERDIKYIESVKDDPRSPEGEAIMKLGMYLVLVHFEKDAKRS